MKMKAALTRLKSFTPKSPSAEPGPMLARGCRSWEEDTQTAEESVSLSNSAWHRRSHSTDRGCNDAGEYMQKKGSNKS